jgi:hypothetical protein
LPSRTESFSSEFVIQATRHRTDEKIYAVSGQGRAIVDALWNTDRCAYLELVDQRLRLFQQPGSYQVVLM